MLKRLLWLKALIGIAWIPSATGDVYRFEGKSGTVYYAERPSAGKATGVPPRPQDAIHGPLRRVPTMESVDALPQGSTDIDHWIAQAATTYELDPKLLHAVIGTESAYNPFAVSPKGARGLMQLMPATAARFRVDDPFDARENILGGSRYLRSLMGLFNQDVELALAAYNAGEQNVIRYGHRIPPFQETQSYVSKVLSRYRR